MSTNGRKFTSCPWNRTGDHPKAILDSLTGASSCCPRTYGALTVHRSKNMSAGKQLGQCN